MDISYTTNTFWLEYLLPRSVRRERGVGIIQYQKNESETTFVWTGPERLSGAVVQSGNCFAEPHASD